MNDAVANFGFSALGATISRPASIRISTGNPGCHARIEAGIRARKLDVPVKHTIEVLDEAYRGSGVGGSLGCSSGLLVPSSTLLTKTWQ